MNILLAISTLILSTSCVLSSRVTSSSSSIVSPINNNNKRDPFGRIIKHNSSINSSSSRRRVSCDISTTALQQLRGGSSPSDDNDNTDVTNNEEIDTTLVNDPIDKKESSSWGSLFSSKKKSTSTSTDENEEDNEGSFEITMNTNNDGTSNVKVDIETPKSTQDMAPKLMKDVINSANKSLGEKGSVSQTQSVSGGDNKVQIGTTIGKSSNKSKSNHISTKFPISKTELPHFTSMSILMFLFIYVFTTVRDTKDTLVVSNCGAEAIPFLKLYGVMPCATAFIIFYSKLSNVMSKQSLFYVTLIPFFIFYGIFAFVLFPMRDALHFPLSEGSSSGSIGGGALGSALNLVRYWSFSVYFIVSELWASAGVPLLFWSVSYV